MKNLLKRGYRVPVFLIALWWCVTPVCAQVLNPEMGAAVDAADALFKAMKDGDYPAVWTYLTEKTRREIVESVSGRAKKMGLTLDAVALMEDFAGGGPYAKAYWDAFLERFNPDMVLVESTWTPGELKGDRATILIRHRKAEKPAVLEMRKESGQWRVGLDETFGHIQRYILRQ